MLMQVGFQHDYKIIDDGTKVMSTLLQQNKLRLNKAWETPCAYGPLKDYIENFGLGQGAKDVLDRNFDPNKSENLSAVNFWLKHHIRRMATENLINAEISLDGYKGLVKVQNESTSSSPSGRHCGHYKAILDHDDICLVHARMMLMPYLVVLTPMRWEKAVDYMIEKYLGSQKLTGFD
eukprot:1937935-Ditylum_brightwellii.AAC.1